MKRFHVLGVVVALVMCAPEVMAQRGGAIRGGMRGAMVGGMVGGGSGAATGAKVGVVTGATRSAVQRADYRADQQTAITQEADARAKYASSPQYQAATYSNFNQAAPEVLVDSTKLEATDKAQESVIHQDGKAIVAVTYPNDWKLKKGEHAVAATSADGHAWSAISTLNADDKKAGIEKLKAEISKCVQDAQFDEVTETERGALLLTGSGKGKKAGTELVFAVGVFQAAPKQLAAAAFFVDKGMEDHYKSAVKSICETIHCANDTAK